MAEYSEVGMIENPRADDRRDSDIALPVEEDETPEPGFLFRVSPIKPAPIKHPKGSTAEEHDAPEVTAGPARTARTGRADSWAEAVDSEWKEAACEAQAGSVEAVDATGWRDLEKERLMNRFSQLLDEALEDEEPPEGLPEGLLEELASGDDEDASEAVNGPGLYEMWSAMTVLAQEVKLQGRTFKQLNERVASVEPLGEAVRELMDEYDQVQEAAGQAVSERELEIARGAAESARRETLDLLLDMRDRLVRGLDVSEKFQAQASDRDESSGSLWRRFFDRATRAPQSDQSGTWAAVRTLEKGVRLSFERLDSALSDLGIEVVRTLGQPFDPSTMRAVDMVETVDAPDGTVVEEYRSGYRRHDVMIRCAEVRVARAPAPGPGTSDARLQDTGGRHA